MPQYLLVPDLAQLPHPAAFYDIQGRADKKLEDHQGKFTVVLGLVLKRD